MTTTTPDPFPVLVLKDDGARVWGALLMDPNMNALPARIAELFAEPQEVAAWLARLQHEVPEGSKVFGARFAGVLEGPSVQALVTSTPQSCAGQKAVLVYRGDEWFTGLWSTARQDAPLHLESVSDFHGGRVSAAKLAQRAGLDTVRTHATVTGDYGVLLRAVDKATGPLPPFGQAEDHVAVRTLAAWWNSHAPREQRVAAMARLYIWNEPTRLFIAGDPEEPALPVEQLDKCPSWALFEREGFPSVAAMFLRGRRHHGEDDGYTTVLNADGSVAYEVGAQPQELDEAVYCFKGLRTLQAYLLGAG